MSSLEFHIAITKNLQYKTHPDFWPSPRRIFKTSLYYKTCLILETRRCVWRIMEGQVPNISTADNGGIRTKWHIRRGRCCLIPTVSNHSSQAIKSLRYASFAIHAPRLFNALPAHVRNITGCSVDSFKRQLDKYLRTVPDEPQITGYTAIRRADSNSILHMIQLATAQLVSTLEGPDRLSVARGGHPWSPWE